MSRTVLARVAAVTVAVGVTALTGLTGAARAGDGWAPPPDTIVEVRGSARHGFAVHRLDGSVDHLPTLSETLAECGELAARVDRVRCRTAARVGQRALGDTKRALRLARSAR